MLHFSITCGRHCRALRPSAGRSCRMCRARRAGRWWRPAHNRHWRRPPSRALPGRRSRGRGPRRGCCSTLVSSASAIWSALTCCSAEPYCAKPSSVKAVNSARCSSRLAYTIPGRAGRTSETRSIAFYRGAGKSPTVRWAGIQVRPLRTRICPATADSYLSVIAGHNQAEDPCQACVHHRGPRGGVELAYG